MDPILRKGVIDDIPCYLVERSALTIVLALRSSWVFDRPVWVEFPGNEVLCITYAISDTKFCVDPYQLRKV